MQKTLRFVFFGFCIVMAMLLVVTGCTKNTPSSGGGTAAAGTAAAERAGSGSGAGYPLTISHAFGSTVLERAPERIATIAWCNQDVPLALGIVPVGFSEANYGVTDGSGLHPWTAEALKSLGVTSPNLFRDSTGLDFEAVSDAQPDVILASYSGITAEEYELLSAIAPVIAYPAQPWQTFWREQTLLNAEGMGRREDGERLVTEVEALIAEKLREYPGVAGKTAAFFYFMPTDFSKFYVYLPSDPRAAYLTDLGMVHPSSVLKKAEADSSFAVLVSAEYVEDFADVDIIVAYGDAALLAELRKDPLLGKLPAIRRGSVVFLTDNTPLAASSTPSVLSIPASIDEYLSLFAAAAEQVQ